MKDNFNALDFLSAGGFNFSSDALKPAKKKGLGFKRRKTKAAKKRDLKALLPFMPHKKAAIRTGFEGWPVTLSWPATDEIVVDHHPDARAEYPHH